MLIKFKKKTTLIKSDKPKYTSLDAVMDYSRDFSIFYSGVENNTYFEGCYDMGIRNFLMSYHYIRSRHLSFSDYLGISLFIDSGAHTYQNDSKYCEISEEDWEKHVAKYIKWAEKNKNLIFTIVNCDFENMVSPKTVNRWNEQYFEPFMLRTGIPVCFVWHQNSYHDWDYYCKRYPYIGFSSVNTEGVSIEMSEYKSRLRTAQKHNTLVHGFGMTRTSMLPELPFYTVDSTSWKSGFRYGQIAIWNGKKVQMFGKEDLQTKVFPITRTYKDLILDEEKIINYYEPEVLRANVYAYIKAEEYINQRLRRLVYWKKVKPVKTDISNLPLDFFPSADWVDGGETYFDLKEQAKKMNINPDLEQGLDVLIADMTMLLNWDNPEYKIAKENYILDDYAIIKSLHDTYINRIVPDTDNRINDLVDFFKITLKLIGGLIIMTNENILKLLNEMDINNSDLKTIEAYQSLVEGVKNNIRTAINKAVGKSTLAKNAKAIIKNATKRASHRETHGAWIEAKTGKQYVCDGFRILEINDPIELPILPGDIESKDYLKAYKVVEEAKQKDTYDLEIPSIQELKAEIKILKSQMSVKERKSKKVAITLIDKGLTLDAQYLLEISEALGGVEIIKVLVNSKGIEPVYTENEIGTGLILPVRNINKRLKGYWY